MNQVLRLFLLVECGCFALASTIHAGLLFDGYAHQAASIAESVIALILLVGYGLSSISVPRTQLVALIAQALAFTGTLVGVGTIVAGFGPRTVPDVVYHAAMLVLLAAGMFLSTAPARRLRAV